MPEELLILDTGVDLNNNTGKDFLQCKILRPNTHLHVLFDTLPGKGMSNSVGSKKITFKVIRHKNNI